jgi:hypothetical protein
LVRRFLTNQEDTKHVGIVISRFDHVDKILPWFQNSCDVEKVVLTFLRIRIWRDYEFLDASLVQLDSACLRPVLCERCSVKADTSNLNL